MNRRNDYKMALLVESVIHDTAMPTPVAAARQLAELGVPLEVAMRVITRPGERRHQSEAAEPIQVEELKELRTPLPGQRSA